MRSRSVFWGFLIGCLIIGSARMSVAQSKVGTTAAPFLGISVGPRATAMGGAFTAVANDATALYYNPGAISRFGKSEFIFSQTDWLVNTHFNWIGMIYNMGEIGTLGFSLTNLDYGEEEVTTVLEPEGTGETWGATDFAAGISYARNLTDRFSIGGTVKYIQMKVWNEKASSMALDIGLLFITGFHDMRLGMSIANFGNDMRMEGKELLHRIDLDPNSVGNNETIVANLKTEKWPLPLFFRVGLAMDVMKLAGNRLTLSVDALRPSDNTEIVNVGTELGIHEYVFLRAGYKSLFRDESEEGLTAGAGINLAWGGAISLSLDYTYADFGLFEDIQMISAGFRF